KVDVRQEMRAFCGAIGRPKLRTVSAVIGPEQRMPSIEGKEIRRIAAAWTRIDVIHQARVFGSTVAGPQLNPVGPVLGIEQRPPVTQAPEIGGSADNRASLVLKIGTARVAAAIWIDVSQQMRALRRAVGHPKLAPASTGLSAENKL